MVLDKLNCCKFVGSGNTQIYNQLKNVCSEKYGKSQQS